MSYKTCNDITGALINCEHEFYRRVVAPYEDKKIIENGDVYEKTDLIVHGNVKAFGDVVAFCEKGDFNV